MTGTRYLADFIDNADILFQSLLERIEWDTRMQARKTASYGQAYNYSQISYPFQPMLPELNDLLPKIHEVVGFTPNNCLINLYEAASSRMGYHADQTDILAADTGIVIISLGSARNITFRQIDAPEIKHTLSLASGSLFYMDQNTQHHWQHAILPSKTGNAARISLTFRQLR